MENLLTLAAVDLKIMYVYFILKRQNGISLHTLIDDCMITYKKKEYSCIHIHNEYAYEPQYRCRS